MMTIFGLLLLSLAATGVTCDLVEHRRRTRGVADITKALDR